MEQMTRNRNKKKIEEIHKTIQSHSKNCRDVELGSTHMYRVAQKKRGQRVSLQIFLKTPRPNYVDVGEYTVLCVERNNYLFV